MTTPELRAAILRESEVELEIQRGLPIEEWMAIGRDLRKRGSRLAWQLADWLHYGSWEYGDGYRQAIESLGLDYGTGRVYASVAGKFSRTRRRPLPMTFAHHRIVASLGFAEQDHWLDQAEQHGWSQHELEQRLRSARQLLSRDNNSDPADLVVLRFTIPHDRQQRWNAAANAAGQDLQTWLIDTADRAAA